MKCVCDTPRACAARGLCRREARELAAHVARTRKALSGAPMQPANVLPFPRRPNAPTPPRKK